MAEFVKVETDGAVAVVTLDHPPVNALSARLLEELEDEYDRLDRSDETRAMVFRGAGEKAFVAGADIKYMHGLAPLEAREWGELGHRCAELLETMAKPTIAAVNGFALGGGCELALACDLRLASTTAKLGQPEINLGIMPGWGGSQRLARTTTLGYAKELVFTGRTVGADEALARGLVNEVHEPSELLPRALALAGELAGKSPLALAAAKEATNLACSGDHRDNLNAEAVLFSLLFSSDDQSEGMAAFVEKREPRFTGR
jgi:enoyl-CoA hydratase